MTSPEGARPAGGALRLLRELLGSAAAPAGNRAVELLTGLIPVVPRELLSAVATASVDLPEIERGTVLEELVPRLADAGDGDLLQRVVRSGGAIVDEYRRARTLSHFAPQLPQGMQADLVAAADELGEDFWRAKVLVNVPEDIPAAPRGIAPEAWTAWARTVPEHQASGSAAFAGPGPAYSGETGGLLAVGAVSHSVRDAGYAEVRALLDAAVGSPEDQAGEVDAALRLARSLGNPLARTLALVEIADLQGRRAVIVGEALAAARAISEPTGRVVGLAKVAPLLEPSRRAAVIEEAVTTARAVSDPADRVMALLQVVPSVAAEGRLAVSEAALTSARSIASPHLRSLRLAEVSRIVTGQPRQQVLGEALASAREIRARPDRALPLAQIAPYLPDEERPDVLAETLTESRTLAGRDRRTDVLTVLARNLTEQEADAAQHRQVLSQRLRRVLDQFGAEPARALMAESVRDLAAVTGTGITRADSGVVAADTGEAEVGAASPPVPEPAGQGGPPDGHQGPRPSRAESARTGRPAAGRERAVSTGFSSPVAPDTPILRTMALACEMPYYFWLEIGRPVPGAIDLARESLPDSVPASARLQVALFAYPGELNVKPEAAVGEMELRPDGSAVVLRQPGSDLAIGSNRLRKRLFFPVDAPARSGVARLRCNIYYHGLLIQSRLVRARIMRHPVAASRALSTTVDYRLSRRLSPDHLTTLSPHRLSILLNNNGQGTHGLRVLAVDGAEVYRRDATLDAGAVNTQRRLARNALRWAAWRKETDWTEDSVYHYADGRRDLPRLREDLISLAVSGSRLLLALLDAIASVQGTTAYDELDALAPLLREPAFVQLALKESPRSVAPVELIYDYRITPSAPTLGLCGSFADAFSDDVPMEQVPCFAGQCPQAAPDADPTLICPSGFWGYRHYLGVPFSLGGAADVPGELEYAESPQVTVGVFRDFKLVDKHWENLQALADGLDWTYADTRQETIRSLRESQPQLVYLYCHGGVQRAVPYIRVETKAVYPITPDDLFQERVSWKQSRPLVFMNGCETAGLQPEQAIRFVNFFVRTASASGVIGTQITVFEELACDFAEECLRQFLVEGKSIGEAVRAARLKLLRIGNPLGLVYIPFALASLRLANRSATRGD